MSTQNTFKFPIILLVITPHLSAYGTEKQWLCSSIPSVPSESHTLDQTVFNCVPALPQTDQQNQTTEQSPSNAGEKESKPAQDTPREPIGDAILGEEPPDDISRLFLRESEVLLKPREIQFTAGLEYTKTDKSENLRLLRERGVSIPLNLSVGVGDRLEAFFAVPILYSQSEFIAFNEADKIDGYGIGDVSIGLTYKLASETVSRPSISSSLSYTIPTGTEANPDDPNSINFTSGIRNVGTTFSLTKSVDPAVLFANIGYTRAFNKSENGQTLKPGDSINYGFGAGFSINSAVALSGRFGGTFSFDTKVENTTIIGSGSEPISFDISLSYQLSNRKRIESSINFGLNNDASDAIVGFSYIYTLSQNK